MVRILVVEDSATQAHLLRSLLEAEGFTVEVAAHAQAGLDRVRAAAFDLVLSDVVMPDQSGFELCRQIKIDPATKDTPVVLLTHLNNPLDILQGLECGADNFLTKPVDGPYLVSRLRSVLANRAAAAGTPLEFRGRGVSITSDKSQILDLLLAAVEEVSRAQARERETARVRDCLERDAQELVAVGRRKEAYLAMLAHELRNPLAPIMSSLHLALQPNTEAPVRTRALETVQRQFRHLRRLLDDLLDASRLAWGKVQLQAQRLDLVRLVRLAAEDRRPVLEQAGLTLELHLPQTPAWVQGDSTRLAQVIHNLLDNATKFTPRGGHVTVALTSDPTADLVALCVRDTGIGIEPALLPEVFTALCQGDRSLDRPHGGLGLGLAVVKALVEMHGGTVAAQSAGPGHGAEFTIRLHQDAEPAALSRATAAPAVNKQRRRILVIEDNHDAAETLRILLELHGHEVRVAHSGPDGVQAAAAWQPCAVVSDIGLPGFDGYEVARQLRGAPATEKALLVALTGYGDEDDFQKSRAAGFDHHLTKPADPADLERMLTSHTGVPTLEV